MSKYAAFSILPGLDGAAPVHTTHLFITGVPSEQQLREALQRSGRDPSLTKPGLQLLCSAESQWPPEVEGDVGAVETISWSALEEEAASWRRITIRVSPQVHVIAEAEAERRGKSLTQFCVDAIEAQIRTRSHRIAHSIFKSFYSFDEPKSTSLSTLQRDASQFVPDCSFPETVDVLKRLNPRFIALDKFVQIGPGGHWTPVLYTGDDERFFYWGDFRLKVTPDGRAYAQALMDQFSEGK